MTTRPDDETKYTPKAPGAFERGPNNLQHWVKEGGDFPLASGRYHVFINYGCGWSHQVMLARAAKGLQNVVSMSHTGLKLLGARALPSIAAGTCRSIRADTASRVPTTCTTRIWIMGRHS